MSQIPDPIEITAITNEGYIHEKTEREIMDELVEGFNQLVAYLDSISERL